jgi:hypothetical protein
MSLVHIDFPSGQTGLYGTTTSFLSDGMYAEVSDLVLVEDPDPIITGTVAQVSGGVVNGKSNKLRKVLPSGQATVGMGARWYLPSLPSNSAHPHPFRFLDVSNNEVASVEVETTGAITVNYNGSSFTTTGPVIVSNAWQHVEAKVFVNATTGTIQVRVEGTVVINLTALNTGTNNIAQVALCAENSGATLMTPDHYYVKDWIIWTGAGTVNNDFLGSCAVYEIIPSSDDTFNWAASSGTTGFNLINESPPDDNTSYIYAVYPAPVASKFNLTDLPSTVTSVKGLYVVHRSKKTDGGDGNLQAGLVSGSSTALGTDRPLTTAYTYWADISELDPATSTAWTRISVNAAKLQLNRTL